MKPWQAILMYLGGVLIFVSLSYGYYLQFEKVYNYKVEFYYTKQIIGLPKLSGYWQPITTYDMKGANQCDALIKQLKNDYKMPVKSCKRLDELVVWQEFREQR